MSLQNTSQLMQLRSFDRDERETALEELVEVGDPLLIAEAFKVLDAEGHSLHPITIESLAISLNANNKHNYLKPIISYIEESPSSKIGINCIHILGEVAYLQADELDSRIVPTLVETAKASLIEGNVYALSASNKTFSACIHALRECAREGSVVESENFIENIFTLFYESEEDLDDLLLLPILEVIFSLKKENLLMRLKDLVLKNSLRSEISERINDFLEGKELGDQWW